MSEMPNSTEVLLEDRAAIEAMDSVHANIQEVFAPIEATPDKFNYDTGVKGVEAVFDSGNELSVRIDTGDSNVTSAGARKVNKIIDGKSEMFEHVSISFGETDTYKKEYPGHVRVARGANAEKRLSTGEVTFTSYTGHNESDPTWSKKTGAEAAADFAAQSNEFAQQLEAKRQATTISRTSKLLTKLGLK